MDSELHRIGHHVAASYTLNENNERWLCYGSSKHAGQQRVSRIFTRAFFTSSSFVMLYAGGIGRTGPLRLLKHSYEISHVNRRALSNALQGSAERHSNWGRIRGSQRVSDRYKEPTPSGLISPIFCPGVLYHYLAHSQIRLDC